MYFSIYGVQKTWLDKQLESPVSENPLTTNKGNGPKHCWSLNDRAFIIFIDPCEDN